MSRRQLPPQIKKIEVRDPTTGKTVVRYQVTVDAGENIATGKRQQVRRRYATEKQARDTLAEITDQASKGHLRCPQGRDCRRTVRRLACVTA